MTLLDELLISSTIENTKGCSYYKSSYSSNLDLFASSLRYHDEDLLKSLFNAAYNENRELALANLLYLLDVRGGKGERRVFKVLFKHLCGLNSHDASIILHYIPELGRWDYVLEGLSTPLEVEVIALIHAQIKEDLVSDHPSLLGKWLPTLRTHKRVNPMAKYLISKLNLSEKEYRYLLKALRYKLNLVETRVTNKDYEGVNYSSVPAKAMMKYNATFLRDDTDAFNSYKDSLKRGEASIKVSGLNPHEIVKRVFSGKTNVDILDSMWREMSKPFNLNKNVLVMADTSGSMTWGSGNAIAASLGLAIFTAENNTGLFKDYFMSFSSRPILERVYGANIHDKVFNIKPRCESTDIDKAFKLLLDTCVKAKAKKDEMPSHIIIISDMEFDEGVYSRGGTSFHGWRDAYKEAGYELPKIIFWNAGDDTYGLPISKYDNDCIMVSGYSTSVLNHILDLEEYNPESEMQVALDKYLKLINKWE